MMQISKMNGCQDEIFVKGEIIIIYGDHYIIRIFFLVILSKPLRNLYSSRYVYRKWFLYYIFHIPHFLTPLAHGTRTHTLSLVLG